MTNIAIFVSGSGTNCENLIKHFSGSSEVCCALVTPWCVPSDWAFLLPW